MLEALVGKSVIPLSDLLWRFGLAALFGFLLGLDRELRGITAGVRTHILVALSSAMTMLIALKLFEQLTERGDADPDIDVELNLDSASRRRAKAHSLLDYSCEHRGPSRSIWLVASAFRVIKQTSSA